MQKVCLKIFVVVLSLLFFNSDVAAQGRPVVLVTKTTAAKPPIAAASGLVIVTEPKAAVWLNELRRGTTDASGRLQIDKLPAGARKLRVRAVGFAEKSLSLTPAQRGEVRVELTKSTDEAELAFQQAELLRESPREAADRQKSVELYRKAIKLRPNFPLAHVGLARLLEDMRDPDAALAEVAAARKDSPNYAEASVVEGRIYRSESVADPDNAVKAFRRAIRESRNFNPEAHTGLALAYKDKTDYASAVAAFKIAIVQLADTEPIVYQLLGETYEEMKRPKDAITAYEKFLQLAPNSTQAVALRSIIEQLKRKDSGDMIELMPQ